MLREGRPWPGLRVRTVPPVGRGRKNVLESGENRNAELGRKVRRAV